MRVWLWHIATFGCTAKIDRNRGNADMPGPAVGSTRSRMTRSGHRGRDVSELVRCKFTYSQVAFWVRVPRAVARR
jgi:hypothetical protein